jgi:hypothetical protein
MRREFSIRLVLCGLVQRVCGISARAAQPPAIRGSRAFLSLFRAALGVSLGALLAACGGGGGSAGSMLPQAPATKSAAATAKVVVSITIPALSSGSSALRRKPRYVSLNTQSASVAVNGGAPVVVSLTPTSPNCTVLASGSRSCSLSVSAPVGNDTFTETLYASTDGSGAALSVGTTSATITPGVANTVLLTLDGVIASLSLLLDTATTPIIGTPTLIGLTVDFKDAAGASIIGSEPFTTPVKLTNSDTSGATTLSKTTLNSPADAATLTIAYTGASIAQAVIGASAGSIIAPTVTIAPQAAATPPPTTFNDYTTFGFDNGRSVFNPNSTPITPASVQNLHLAWQAQLGGGDFNTWAQPILATGIAGHAGVLFSGGGSGRMYGYDALTGKMMWQRSTGQETYTCQNGNNIIFGVGGTAAYDPASKSIYMVGNFNSGPDGAAANTLYHLDAATGTLLGQVNFAPINSSWPSLDFSHTSVTLGNNGLAYVGTGATCDISSWRGRVAAINVPSMTLAGTFFTTWDPNNTHGQGNTPWGGGGVWGWGGVSLDSSGDVFTGVGNTDDGTTANGTIVAPFKPSPNEDSGLGDAFIKISPDLSTLMSANHPIPNSQFQGASVDLDLNGTPVLFQPNGVGCNPMAALQAKSGSIYLYDRTQISNGPVASYQLAPSTYADGFLGGPAYSPATGLLYVGVSSSNQSLFAPGMVAIDPGCGHPSIAWHAAFGPDSYAPGSVTSPGKPRSVPAVSAGGVVFIGTICSPSGSGCGSTSASASLRSTQAVRKPLICCAPPGTGGGAVWALDASTGTVLNSGNPIIITSAPLRMPPTIDGNWVFVLDNSGNLYALTLDSKFTATSTVQRAPDSRMLNVWEAQPRPK